MLLGVVFVTLPHANFRYENRCWAREHGDEGEPEHEDEGAVGDLGSELDPSSSLTL